LDSDTQKLIILVKFEESNTIGFTQKQLFNEAIKTAQKYLFNVYLILWYNQLIQKSKFKSLKSISWLKNQYIKKNEYKKIGPCNRQLYQPVQTEYQIDFGRLDNQTFDYHW